MKRTDTPEVAAFRASLPTVHDSERLRLEKLNVTAKTDDDRAYWARRLAAHA